MYWYEAPIYRQPPPDHEAEDARDLDFVAGVAGMSPADLTAALEDRTAVIGDDVLARLGMPPATRDTTGRTRVAAYMAVRAQTRRAVPQHASALPGRLVDGAVVACVVGGTAVPAYGREACLVAAREPLTDVGWVPLDEDAARTFYKGVYGRDPSPAQLCGGLNRHVPAPPSGGAA